MFTRLAPVRCILGLSLLLAAAGCATTGSSGSKGRAHPGDTLPDLELSSLTGGSDIQLASLRGHVVLLDIWASWCAPCKEELPLLDEMATRLKSRGVRIVAVSIDQERADAEAFLRTKPSWALTLAHDPKGRVPDTLQPEKMPTSYVVDAEGTIRYVNAGFTRADAETLEEHLVELTKDR